MLLSHSLARSAMAIIALSCLTQKAVAQTAQYGTAPPAQLALVTPSAANNMQMMRSDASILFTSGQYLAASEVYKRLLQLGSVDATDRYYLGDALYHANNFQQAAIAFEQAIQLNPKLSQAYVRLGETYIALHQKDKAAQVCSSGLNVVADPYMKDQLTNLLKVAVHQERKQVRSHQLPVGRMPSES